MRRDRIASWLAIVSVASNCSPSAEEETKLPTEVPVQVGTIAKVTLHRWVTAYGRVEPEPATTGSPAASARVAAPFTAIVAEASRAEGQRVNKGDVLFRLDTRTEDARLAKARLAAQFAERVLERQRKLLLVEGTSERQVEEAEQQVASARRELEAVRMQRSLFEVESPLSGTVVAIHARVGETVDPSTPLAEVVDLDRLVARADVPSAEADLLRPGQRVEILATRTGTKALSREGNVAYVGSNVDLRAGTVVVRASIPAGSGIRPGELVRARIACEERKDRLAVPKESVVQSEDSASIAIVDGDQAIRKEVGAGLADGAWIEVEGEGLREGMKVVTTGAYGLPEKTKIRVVSR